MRAVPLTVIDTHTILALVVERVLTLYVDGYFVNQWDASCVVALEEKALAYSMARALLRDGGGVTPALVNQTKLARVPALQHGEVWLTESNAIIEYLEDVFPPPAYPRLLPAEPHARAQARQWMAFVRSDLWALRTERSWWMCVYPEPTPRPLSRDGERDSRELVNLVDRLAGAGELDPARWNMAHADLALTLIRLGRTGYPLPERVSTFLDTAVKRPSMRAYLDHPRPPFRPPDAYAAG
jgi:glutathione S-transferase